MSHEQSLAQFGGSTGLRDEGLPDSALGKPENLFAYGKPGIFDLAASYAFGLVKIIHSSTATSAPALSRPWYFWS